MPELKRLVLLVTVWPGPSRFVQVTTVPGATVNNAGLKANPWMVTPAVLPAGVGVGDGVAVGTGVGVAVGVGAAVGAGVGVGVGTAVGVAVAAGTGVAVGVAVGSGVGVAVAIGPLALTVTSPVI